jgi:hypothetical protein
MLMITQVLLDKQRNEPVFQASAHHRRNPLCQDARQKDPDLTENSRCLGSC